MTDIGNVDLQSIATVREAIHPHSVVEVTCGLAVNRDDVQAPEILPATGVSDVRAAFDHRRNALRLFDHVSREAVRDMVLANHDLDIDAEVVRVAKDFDYLTNYSLAALQKIEDLGVDDHAIQIPRTFDLDGRYAYAML